MKLDKLKKEFPEIFADYNFEVDKEWETLLYATATRVRRYIAEGHGKHSSDFFHLYPEHFGWTRLYFSLLYQDKIEKVFDRVKEEFPDFYFHICFKCGAGWSDIIWRLSSSIRFHIARHPEHNHDDKEHGFYVNQVEEKEGVLDYRVSTACEEIYELIEHARKESKRTCEICGREGETRDVGRMYTRCEECFVKLKD